MSLFRENLVICRTSHLTRYIRGIKGYMIAKHDMLLKISRNIIYFFARRLSHACIRIHIFRKKMVLLQSKIFFVGMKILLLWTVDNFRSMKTLHVHTSIRFVTRPSFGSFTARTIIDTKALSQ